MVEKNLGEVMGYEAVKSAKKIGSANQDTSTGSPFPRTSALSCQESTEECGCQGRVERLGCEARYGKRFQGLTTSSLTRGRSFFRVARGASRSGSFASMCVCSKRDFDERGGVHDRA